MEKKEFDAVEMTRRIRDHHYELLKDASPQERIRFIREKALRMHEYVARRLEDESSPAEEAHKAGGGSLDPA
ncbi:MAG TPA: hypothetical protein VF615_14830 [Longimicrobiaceae bacterium]|jgi:predicted subunit of tRNA(5-methylaminomethyl-2-thiouridylate) methyltransferase